MDPAQYRVMIVDDQAPQGLLEGEPRLAVVAEARTGHEALASGAGDRVAVLRHAVVCGWVNVAPRPTAEPGRTTAEGTSRIA